MNNILLVKSSHQFRIIRFYKLIYIKKLTWSSSGQLVQILLIFIFLNGVVLISILIFFLNWINPPNLYLQLLLDLHVRFNYYLTFYINLLAKSPRAEKRERERGAQRQGYIYIYIFRVICAGLNHGFAKFKLIIFLNCFNKLISKINF
jgi:hypothetical protein